MHIGFVDTLQKYPTIWSFDSGPAATRLEPVRGDAERAHRVGNVVRARDGSPTQVDRGRRSSPASYPFITLIVIVITANHYVIDAVGGLVILSIGWVVAHRFTRAGRGEPLPELAGSP